MEPWLYTVKFLLIVQLTYFEVSLCCGKSETSVTFCRYHVIYGYLDDHVCRSFQCRILLHFGAGAEV